MPIGADIKSSHPNGAMARYPRHGQDETRPALPVHPNQPKMQIALERLRDQKSSRAMPEPFQEDLTITFKFYSFEFY